MWYWLKKNEMVIRKTTDLEWLVSPGYKEMSTKIASLEAFNKEYRKAWEERGDLLDSLLTICPELEKFRKVEYFSPTPGFRVERRIWNSPAIAEAAALINEDRADAARRKRVADLLADEE